MIHRLCGLLLSVLPLLASAGECRTRALEDARAKWAAAQINSYRYTLCYAFRPGTDLEFDVTEIEIDDITGFDTIPGLLDLIQKHLQQPDMAVSKCTFHVELGSPMTYSYSSAYVTDSDAGFSIADLEILQ